PRPAPRRRTVHRLPSGIPRPSDRQLISEEGGSPGRGELLVVRRGRLGHLFFAAVFLESAVDGAHHALFPRITWTALGRLPFAVLPLFIAIPRLRIGLTRQKPPSIIEEWLNPSGARWT